MIPKDKAKELVNKIYYTLPNNGHINQGINSCASRYDEAKKCAIIAINEILDVDCHDMSEQLFDKHIEYYTQVLTEIEKLWKVVIRAENSLTKLVDDMKRRYEAQT